LDIFVRWASYWTTGGIAVGFVVMLQTFIAASVLTIIWAMIVAVARMSPSRILQYIAVGYIELFRGTPLLVQLLIFFAAVPIITGIKLRPFETAVLALTLNAGAYLAENYRSGLQAVPRGQQEAATALGLSNAQVFQRVTLPVALRVILPAIGNIIASLLLTTPFVFFVGLEDMMARATQIMNRTADFSVFLFVTIIYVALGLLLFAGNSWHERRFKPIA
jgi:polar amino acid transport system permease protein